MTDQLDRIEKLAKDLLHHLETDVSNQRLIEEIRDLHHTAQVMVEGIVGQMTTLIELITQGGGNIPPQPEPTPPSIPYPNLDRVEMRKNAPIMEISHYNGKDVPVLRRHKKENGKPIVAKEGKKLIVLAKVKIDGYRNYAFRLISDQHVDGDSLPLSNTTKKNKAKQIDGYLYIQKRLVKML